MFVNPHFKVFSACAACVRPYQSSRGLTKLEQAPIWNWALGPITNYQCGQLNLFTCVCMCVQLCVCIVFLQSLKQLFVLVTTITLLILSLSFVLTVSEFLIFLCILIQHFCPGIPLCSNSFSSVPPNFYFFLNNTNFGIFKR